MSNMFTQMLQLSLYIYIIIL